MTIVRLENLTKKFGETIAVQNVNLEMVDERLTVLVGPSGCGKTTLLRMLAGLEEPTEGKLFIGDKEVAHIPAWDRNVAMVFQSYALYPHMSVFKNMAFPLEARGFSKDHIKKQVEESALILGLDNLLDRYPRQLSGGQMQRVAIGRAIVRQPDLFLMDEPLSNLDAKLRVNTRAELKRLQRDLGVTTVYVTHDQAEAMTLADQLVVMRQGRVLQVGFPEEIYNHPHEMFVAGFIGSPGMNFVPCHLNAERTHLENDYLSYELPPRIQANLGDISPAQDLILGIRPEDINIEFHHEANSIKASVYIAEALGKETLVTATCGDIMLKLFVPPNLRMYQKIGDEIWLRVAPQGLRLFDATTEKLLIDGAKILMAEDDG